MTLTKARIVDSVQSRTGFSRKHSADMIENLLDIIKKTLENGEDVVVSGFGKFCVKEKNKRRGRNPATGEDMMLDSRRVVTFKCSGVLKDRINQSHR